jgi:uncharacterized protein (TIGR02453 family)
MAKTNNTYFTPSSLKFLRDLKAHNEKAWFDANRSSFEESVKGPALQLVSDLQPVLKKISPRFVADPRPNGGSLSRMNRDIRFSKDKSPYKTALFLHFKHTAGNEEAMPSFYMHIEPGASTVGGGVWQPGPKPLKKIRDSIVRDPGGWARAAADGVNGACLMSSGETLKRVPPGYDPEFRFADDLRRKDFGVHRPLADSTLTGSKLIDEIGESLRAASPLLKFLCKAVGLPF